jgi:protein gp37
MSEISKIAWTDATYNPWWGCTKVSDACKYCYAERDAKRFGGTTEFWGEGTHRRFFNEGHWNEPLKWNEKARTTGKRIKVFCGSMCDVFEKREDLDIHRFHLWTLIEKTYYLNWLLLTKRPENIVMSIPFEWKFGKLPSNVWFGTTIEKQEYVDRLIDIAAVKSWTDNIFVSVEPMLGPVDFGELWHIPKWVIIGGESGSNARPMDMKWAFDLLLKANENKVPTFMKQLGGYPDKRDNINYFPGYLRIREFPLGL